MPTAWPEDRVHQTHPPRPVARADRARTLKPPERATLDQALPIRQERGGAQGLPIAECKRQADAWPLKARHDALPKNETPLMIRGTIVWTDFLIRTYRQCLPDPQSQQLIAQLETSRAQQLKVCQQISTNPDNCGISPF